MLRLARLTKRFGSFTALDGLDFEVRSGEIVALLGENGAGKSTTISLIGGELAADEGTLELDGQPRRFRNPRAAAAAGIGVVHQHFALVSTFTVAESLAFHAASGGAFYRAREWEARAHDWAATLGWKLDPRRRIGELSVGEQQRVEILKALFGGKTKTRLLLLDEPTANLTPREADELFATLRRLREDGLGLVFVSHKLREVLALCDRAVVLRHGKLVGERAMGATSSRELADLMVGSSDSGPRDAASLGDVTVSSAPLAQAGEVRLRARGLCAPGLKDVTLTVRLGEIVGLAGVDGNGQRALFELIAGLQKPASGTLEFPGLEGSVGLVPPDRRSEGLILNFDVAENLALAAPLRKAFAKPGLFHWKDARARARELMTEFDVRSPQTHGQRGPERTPVGRLSGGNAQKVVLARALASRPSLVVVVDPTRGLDVGASAFVHQQLQDAAARGAAVLLISTDLDEVLALSHRIGAFFAGKILPGSGDLLPASCGREEVGRLMGGDESFLEPPAKPRHRDAYEGAPA